MIRQSFQEISPISRLPEPEALHFRVIITHRGIAIRSTMQVEIDQLLQIRPHDLICIDEDDLLEVHGEEHVEEQDLVRPDDTLFLLLGAQP